MSNMKTCLWSTEMTGAQLDHLSKELLEQPIFGDLRTQEAGLD